MTHREVFPALVRAAGWRRGAELGIGHGHLAARLLSTCPALTTLICVDWFTRPDWREAAVRRLTPFGARCQLLACSTREAAPQVADGSLDFVFVDAGHQYAAVQEDLRHWAPKMRRGGWLGGHDYHPTHPGVIRAVDEAYGAAVQQEPGAIWWVVAA